MGLLDPGETLDQLEILEHLVIKVHKGPLDLMASLEHKGQEAHQDNQDKQGQVDQ